MLKTIFIELLSKYSSNTNLHRTLWNEIEKQYSSTKRHYHSLSHLENLLIELNEIKSNIKDWDTTLFSLYYHDIIYDAKSSKNEEKSAELAIKRLKDIGYPPLKIEHCFNQIIATKSHEVNEDSDTNLFTDADLSILGSCWETYTTYISQIRKEYSIYPDFIYKPGRQKVLHHFLDMQRIFKTDYFYFKFEQQARQNIRKELKLLSS